MACTKQRDAGAAAPMARIVPKPKPVLLPTEAVKGAAYLCAQSPTGAMTTPTHMVLSTPVNAPSTQWRTEICPGAPTRHAQFSLSSGESTPGSQGYRSPVSPLAHPHLARPLFRRTTAPIIPLVKAAEASEPQPRSPVVAVQATSPVSSAKPVLFSRPVYHAQTPVVAAVKGGVGGGVPSMQKTPVPAPVQVYDPLVGPIANTPSPDKRGRNATRHAHEEQTPEAVEKSDRQCRRLLTM
jgi:hypothetical protein